MLISDNVDSHSRKNLTGFAVEIIAHWGVNLDPLRVENSHPNGRLAYSLLTPSTVPELGVMKAFAKSPFLN